MPVIEKKEKSYFCAILKLYILFLSYEWQKIVRLAMLYGFLLGPTRMRNTTFILPCLTRIPTNHGQQVIHLAILHINTTKIHTIHPTSLAIPQTDPDKTTGNTSYTLPQWQNKRNQVLHFTTQITKQQAMSHTYSRKSQK